MPSRWEVELTGPAGAPVPLTAPQAVVSGWLDDPRPRRPATGTAEPGRSGHADPVRKWACGPISPGVGGAASAGSGADPGARAGHAGAGAAIVLGVRLLDDDLAGRLQAATTAGRAIRLGAEHYRIIGGARLAGQVSWEELRRWTGARAWQVRFVTPTCFRRGNRTSPWPAPDSLARGLAERWRQLHPDTTPPAPGPGGGPVWVSDIDGHSEACALTRKTRRNGTWRLDDEVISGFTGRIRYVCDQGSDDEAAAFDALLGFAAFAGVGSHTTYGFGVISPEPTWQPPTTRSGSP